jgi:hypothetical protein
LMGALQSRNQRVLMVESMHPRLLQLCAHRTKIFRIPRALLNQWAHRRPMRWTDQPRPCFVRHNLASANASMNSCAVPRRRSNTACASELFV